MLSVRGYYRVYVDNLGVEFKQEIEELNNDDRYAVEIDVRRNILACVPREFLKIVFYFAKWVF